VGLRASLVELAGPHLKFGEQVQAVFGGRVIHPLFKYWPDLLPAVGAAAGAYLGRGMSSSLIDVISGLLAGLAADMLIARMVIQASRHFIFVVTPSRVLVLRAGTRFQTVQGVFTELPRSAPLGPASGLLHQIPVDGMKVRVHRGFFNEINEADRLLASTVSAR
jgi:hypothetical protein